MRELITFILLILLFACGEPIDKEIQRLNKLEEELQIQPSEERAEAFISGLSNYITKNNSDFNKVEPFIEKGVKIAKDYGFLDKSAGFLWQILRSESYSKDKTPYKMDLGDVMINLNKKHASNVIYKELLNSGLDNQEMNKRRVLIDSVAIEQDDYVQYLFDQIIKNPGEFGINKKAALRYVDAAEALALVNPTHPKSAEHLYGAAEVARGMRTMPKALSLYDWVLEDYPNYEKASTVLFIKGFIMEQEYKRADEAEQLYREFLEKYPDHQMASSAKFLLDNLGKSEEEILRDIENKKVN